MEIVLNDLGDEGAGEAGCTMRVMSEVCSGLLGHAEIGGSSLRSSISLGGLGRGLARADDDIDELFRCDSLAESKDLVSSSETIACNAALGTELGRR